MDLDGMADAQQCFCGALCDQKGRQVARCWICVNAILDAKNEVVRENWRLTELLREQGSKS